MSESESEEKQVCIRCGGEILPGQAFCPMCGQKVGAQLEEAAHKRNNKKIIYISIGVIVAILICGIAFWIQRGVQAKQITLNKKELTIKAGESEKLTYTIDPGNTKDKNVIWKSSNESIATVSDGTITAVNEGNCTITVSTKNDKVDRCNISVTPAAPDLHKIYNQYCNSTYAMIADDDSYLIIDTNPLDVDDYFDINALNAIKSVNQALGLPESVIMKMDSTRALDGMQSYSGDGVEVSWTYHPNNGLQVQYSIVK